MKKRKYKRLRPEAKLAKIAEIIWGVENRCLAADGPVGDFFSNVFDFELKEIRKLARAHEDHPRLKQINVILSEQRPGHWTVQAMKEVWGLVKEFRVD